MAFYVLQHGWHMQNNSVKHYLICWQQADHVEIYVLIKNTSQTIKLYKIQSLLPYICFLYVLGNVTCAVFLSLIAV